MCSGSKAAACLQYCMPQQKEGIRWMECLYTQPTATFIYYHKNRVGTNKGNADE